MQTSQFTTSDLRTLSFWLIAAIIGLYISVQYHDQAFPSASIEFNLSRSDAESQAMAFLKQQGFTPETYRAVTVFDYDDNAKVYLERELGLARADSVMRQDVAIWRWRSRFYRPSEQEEFSVSFSPEGQIVGFSHEIEEAREGPSLDQISARGIAESFLDGHHARSLSDYRLIEGDTREMANRTDHSFTWERRRFRAKEATARIAVTVQGDRIGHYSEFLKVPEAWLRDYAQLRSRNMLMQEVTQSAFFAIILAMLVMLVIGLGRRRLTYRFGAQCGGALALCSLALTLNTLPLAFVQYDTTQSLGSFYSSFIFGALISACGWLVYITLAGAVSVSAYRSGLPEKIAPEFLVTGQTLRSKEYLMSCLVGYLIPLIMLGYITGFYVVGADYGVWSPTAISYTDLASTALPWLYPLTIGLMASISEEFIFRMFAIPFLKRYLKSTFLAVLIPAVIWGFMHSSYPQQPFFIRGLELSVVGIMFGYVFLRFGIVSVLIAHYAFDALLMSLFLFQSANLHFQIAGALVVGIMLIPLIPSLYALIRKRLIYVAANSNAAITDQLDAGEASTAELPDLPPPIAVAAQARPLGRRSLALFVACAMGMTVLWAVLPVTRFLDFVEVKADRIQATEASDSFLTESGVDLQPYRRVATYSQERQLPYIRETRDLASLNELFRTRLVPAGWRVRYFMPLEKEEYRVTIGVSGEVLRFDHLIDENAPGDSLSEQEALKLAVSAVQEAGNDLSNYGLIESRLEKRLARTDHHFVWEDSLATIGEGSFRISATVQGNEAMRVRPYFKTPEAWVRARNESTIYDTVLSILSVSMFGVLIVLAMRVYMQLIRKREVNWQRSILAGIAVSLLGLLSQANGFATIFASYGTTMSMEAFLTSYFNSLYGYAIMMLLGSVVLFSFTESFYRHSFPGSPDIISWFAGVWRCRSDSERTVWREALVLSYGACLLVPGLLHLLAFGEQAIELATGRTSAAVPHTGTYLPEAEAVIGALSDSLLYGGLLLAAILVARHYFPRGLNLAMFVSGLVLLTVAGGSDSWTIFLAQSLRLLLLCFIAYLLIRFAWRRNLLAYIMTIFLLSLTADARALMGGTSGVYYDDGLRTLMLAAVPLGIWFLLRIVRR